MKIGGVCIALLSALGLVLWTACDSSTSRSDSAGSPERLTVGTSSIDLSSLIWIARERGYFAQQGLDIDFKIYESGHLAVRDLDAGRLDLATATEFATANGLLKQPDLRIITVLDRAEDQRLVARRDRGVAKLSDLKGKRIGLTRKSSAEYYLHVLLLLEEVPVQDVQLVDLLPSEQVKAITNGEVDAVMVWQPFALTAQNGLGANAVSWSAQSGQEDYWLLLSRQGVIERRSRAIQRFVAALASSEDFIKNNEAQARSIIAKELGDGHEDSLWKNHKFRLGLDRPLLLKMEAGLTWMDSMQGTQKSHLPDLVNFVHFDALKSVRPGRIGIVH